MRTPTCERRAFTLIELFVVMAIIMILAGIVIAFFPNLQDERRAANGASNLQGWLLLARNKAVQSRLATGLQLLESPDDSRYLTRFRFIQQPDTYSGGRNGWVTSAQGNSVQLSVNVSDHAQQGDYIDIDYGVPRRIVGVGGNSVSLASPLPHPVRSRAFFRIHRQARPETGEALRELPDMVAVDTEECLPNPVPRQILFAPTGEVLNAGNEQRIVLWVMDMSGTSQPTLLAIEVGTGTIAAHPPAPGGDKYAFTKDARSSGL
ncbi:MAG: Tfp pilus assembly protein FimT/FimU [Gemmataceae bacterium]